MVHSRLLAGGVSRPLKRDVRRREPRERFFMTDGDRLVTRKYVLATLGHHKHAPRQAWSHDLGGSVAFDAWEDTWRPRNGVALGEYPLRTNGQHYNRARSIAEPRFGHTQWHEHVDLVLAGKRKVQALVPVRDTSKNGRARWRAKVVKGRVTTDANGEVWLVAEETISV